MIKATVTAAVAALTLCMSPLVPAHADQLSDIKAKGTLVAATEMHYAPFDMLVDGKYEGFCRDLFDEVGKELGVKVDYLDLPFSSILPGLEAKKFDVVTAPVTITAERQKRFTFTLPMGDATVALVRRADDKSIKAPGDIAGKRVGAQKGSAQLAQLKAYAEKLSPPATVKEYVNADEAMADLSNGRIDAVANSMPLLSYAAVQRPESFAVVLPPFGEPTYAAWVLRSGDDSASLLKAINDAILKMHKDGRLKAISTKWFGDVPELPTQMPVVK